MRRTLMALAVLLGLPLTVVACLWDRDTPAQEAKGLPEVVAVLTGRFERNTPLFYEMRLTRVSAQLQSFPEDLAAYDDAGVACDRLGRGDEAVAWMERKRAQLDRLESKSAGVKEHRYRYHANLGTFFVHRWSRQGGDRGKLGEVKAARDQIAKALEINPNAHFGREMYQLQVLNWIIEPPASENLQFLPNILGWAADAFSDLADPQQADDAVRGLSGLVVLGNAWESVDIVYALSIALQHDTLGFAKDRNGGRNSLASLAWLRCRELIDDGKRSILPDAPKGEALKAKLSRPDFLHDGFLHDGFLDQAFVKLRVEAAAWHKARTAFMTGRLQQGRHPDTDADFWTGYTEKSAPDLPTKSLPDVYYEKMRRTRNFSIALFITVPTLLIGSIVGLAIYRGRRERIRHAMFAPKA